ncbi:MAG: GvpL/GvpF family gas vesicle protein [Pseudomonadota bacterium]
MTDYTALALIADGDPLGENTDVHAIRHNGVTALLLPEKRPLIALPQSRKAALQGAARRQAMLEAVMPLGTVLPFRPGQQLTPDDVAPLIDANRSLIDTLQQRFAGLVQYQITVTWQAEGVLKRFRASPELAPLFAAGHANASQIQFAVSRLAERLSGDMQDMLAGTVAECTQLPRVDGMILNSVVLLPESAEAALDAALAQIDAIWADGLHIRQVGPAPPASFATLDPQFVTVGMVAAALETLGIAAGASETAIMTARKDALRRTSAAQEEVNRASEILLAQRRAGTDSFYLCTVLAEDAGTAATQKRAVA